MGDDVGDGPENSFDCEALNTRVDSSVSADVGESVVADVRRKIIRCDGIEIFFP